MNELGNKQLENTLNTLAKGLPIYEVYVHGNINEIFLSLK